jgi:hypothetical protein
VTCAERNTFRLGLRPKRRRPGTRRRGIVREDRIGEIALVKGQGEECLKVCTSFLIDFLVWRRF